jgi:hypothetical protein
MTRGNWQKRVERTVVRRKQEKQRKQNTHDKRLWKGWVQTFLGQLDQNAESIRRQKSSTIVHIWTDSVPVNIKSTKEQQRARGGSIGDNTDHPPEEGEGGGKKGRNRSDSVNNNEPPRGKKKVHPRSKEPAFAEEGNEDDLPLLCKHQFFGGKCASRGQKKGGCRYEHYFKEFVTLHASLHPTGTSQAQATARDTGSTCGEKESSDLKLAEVAASEAMPEDLMDSDPDAMEMVYYCRVELKADENDTKPLSEVVTTLLSNKQLILPSVVYVALNNVLVFDRHRDGVLLSDQDFVVAAAAGDEGMSSAGNRNRRSASIGSEHDGGEKNNEAIIHLPEHALEHILTFLPDAAVAAASQVCNAWFCAIGQNSPNLWLHLLQRRDWPLPAITTTTPSTQDNTPPTPPTTPNHRDAYRNQFLHHYGVLRDARAIETAVAAITTKHACEETEMAFLDFSKRKHAPMPDDVCVSLQEWSPHHILAAYRDDCTLRLFEAEPATGSSKKHCRELVCQSVDPYRKTKKQTCSLEAMDVDEHAIGCLCYVSVRGHGLEGGAYTLVILNRDDFLLGVSSDAAAKGGVSDSANLNVVDIRETVLNFILSSDVVDHRLLPLFDFLEDEGEIGDVDIKVSPWNLVACGYDRWMVEVSVSIPAAGVGGEENVERTRLHLDRKLVLFCASAGAIIWMGESCPLTRPLPSHELNIILGSSRGRPTLGGSRVGCTIVVSSNHSPEIMVCEIEPTGNVQTPQFIESSLLVRENILENGWETFGNRCIAVTPSDVVAMDTQRRHPVADEAGNTRKTVVSFYPHDPAAEEASCANLFLTGELMVRNAVCVRDQYVVAMCTELVHLGGYSDEDIEGLDGQWFAPRGEPEETHLIVIIHVPSRREIGRVHLSGTNGLNRLFPTMSSASGGTMGLALDAKGIVLTGDDVRSVGGAQVLILDDADPKLAKKKKKKGKRASKKDAYFRGHLRS